MKPDSPHGQWRCLHALIALPPFGQTAEAVAGHTKLSKSGCRTRLKEMESMTLVVGSSGQKLRQYWITPLGYKLAMSGKDGQMALRIMRNTHTALEAQRAAELGPIKEKWQNIIDNQMRMICLGVLGGS